MRILLAEDDAHIATFMQRALRDQGYLVEVAADGHTAGQQLHEQSFDLLVLDLNLPRVDGAALLQGLRAARHDLPVIVLTGSNRVEERVRLLDMGADDFLGKPFSFSELCARVRAVLRRRTAAAPTLRHADLEMNLVTRTVTRSGRRIDLTPKEFALLEFLVRNAGHTVTRSMILQQVWNLEFDSHTNVVDVYINYLRRKVDDGFGPRLIQTVRGTGYVLTLPVAITAGQPDETGVRAQA